MAYWDYFEVDGVGLKGSASAYASERSGNQVKVHIDYWMDYYYSGNSSWLSWQGWNQYSGTTTIHEGGYAHSGAASASAEFWVTVGYGAGSIDLLPSLGADNDFASNQNLVVSFGSNYAAPNAPTIGTVTKLSDAKARIAFTGNPTDHRPYSSVQILRSTDGGDYVQIADIGWSSQTSYDDTTISADHSYSYKVTAWNSSGFSSASSASSTIYTTPDAPSGLTAVYNTGSASVTAAWTNNAAHAASYQVQAADNSSFTGATTYTASATTYTDANPPMGTAYYRVRAVDSAGNASAWTSGVKVVTLCAPAAPTVKSPSQGAVFAMPSSVQVTWQHNALDGTAQTAATVAVSTDGGSTWTEGAVSGSTATYSIDTSSLSRDTVVSVKVKTKGTYASYSPYCSPVSFSLREAPSVAITFPATDTSEVTAYPIATTWQNTCRSGSIVETTWELAGITHSLGTATSYSLGVAEKLLDNNAEYDLRVTVKSSYGLTATAVRRFKTDYTEPAPPTVSVAYDADGASASVAIAANDCCTYECDGTEEEGALCSFAFRGVTRYFAMPDVESGDVLWWSRNDAALYLTRKSSLVYSSDSQVDHDVLACGYVGNALIISEIIAAFTEDGLAMQSAAASFSSDTLVLADATAITFDAMPTPDHYVLYRVTADGEELLSDSMAAGGSIVDHIPPLNAAFAYRAGAIATTGAASYVDKDALLEVEGWFYWNYGTAYNSTARMRLAPDFGPSIANNSESVLFEGDEYPTCYGGSANTEDLSTSGVVHGVEGRDAIIRGLGGWKGKRAIFRTPIGEVSPVRVHSLAARNTDIPSIWSIDVGQERVL